MACVAGMFVGLLSLSWSFFFVLLAVFAFVRCFACRVCLCCLLCSAYCACFACFVLLCFDFFARVFASGSCNSISSAARACCYGDCSLLFFFLLGVQHYQKHSIGLP